MVGHLHYEEIKDLLINKNINTFIESGTYKGHTVIEMSNYFKNCYSIEIVKELYEESIENSKRKKRDNIKFILGDSVEELDMLRNVYKDGALFFLDAYLYNSDSWFNMKNFCPIYQELDSILENKFSHSIIIINNINSFGKSVVWKNITLKGIMDIFYYRNLNVIKHFEKNDKLFIILENC